jgi:acyl carrier protein
MENLEKLTNLFVEVFNVDASLINDNFGKDSVETWDSVHQLNIIALLEEYFDLLLEPEDIMACTSFAKAKEILRKNDVEI